jgi:cellulose biosynthesis protein BcsQ
MILTFAHQKGGVGKSTLCLNVAVALSEHLTVGLIDLDPQGSLRDISHLLTSLALIPTPHRLSDLKNLPYELICVDTPPYLSDKLYELFIASNIVIIPTKAGVLPELVPKLVENIHSGVLWTNFVKQTTPHGTNEKNHSIRSVGTGFNEFGFDAVDCASAYGINVALGTGNDVA